MQNTGGCLPGLEKLRFDLVLKIVIANSKIRSQQAVMAQNEQLFRLKKKAFVLPNGKLHGLVINDIAKRRPQFVLGELRHARF